METWLDATVEMVAPSSDGRLLASSGLDNTVRVWDATTEACVQILRDPDHIDASFFSVEWRGLSVYIPPSWNGGMYRLQLIALRMNQCCVQGDRLLNCLANR